ncbi:hypothetical protein [Candidatus Methylopumilus universalis]|uniref:hypothetical protein n=1 Tax=Candidatus Methylopumilus universalis TaxID=2588536 RepID=UPI003BEEE072
MVSYRRGLRGGRGFFHARTVTLSSPWLIVLVVLGFDGGAGCGRALIAARTSMLSSPYLPFGGGLPGRLNFGSGAVVMSTARTSILSSPCLVVLVVLGFGAGSPGVGFDGAAKAFGRTLKPAASVKVKMSFLYKVISLKI